MIMPFSRKKTHITKEHRKIKDLFPEMLNKE